MANISIGPTLVGLRWSVSSSTKLRTALTPSCSATEGVSGHFATCQRGENTGSVLLRIPEVQGFTYGP